MNMPSEERRSGEILRPLHDLEDFFYGDRPMRNLIATICLTLAVLLGNTGSGLGHEGLDGEYFRALKTMGGSGIDWIDAIFRYCVVLLVNIAKVLGISYEALNIWVFIA